MTPPILRIVVTPGEPAGIGPDLCVQLAQQTHAVELVVVGDATLLRERARQLELPLSLRPFDPARPARAQSPGTLVLDEVPLAAHVVPGQLNPANAVSVLAALRRATALCLEGKAAALVTGPVHKGVINDAGIAFTGHTEFLAAECGGMLPVMMLAAPGLRVALATTHLPLSRVSAAINRQDLAAVLRILDGDLRRRFGIESPRILVCGLNPHAGEGGYLGREEIEVIIPTLEALRAEGMNVIGPLPADTLFVPRRLNEADAVLAMYHDQGLPVLKYMGFGQAVNITLGLPLIRTSVDHGTALELAGSGRAEVGSLQAALAAAVAMAEASAPISRFAMGG